MKDKISNKDLEGVQITKGGIEIQIDEQKLTRLLTM